MKYFTISPPSTLAKFVRFFWVLEGDREGYIHRALADVCVEMVFHYNGQFSELTDNKSQLTSLTAMQGPSEAFKRFEIGQSFGIFGVYLYPYVIPMLFDMPASELRNQMPDLTSLMGIEGSMLEERMMLAADNNQRVKIITAFLEKKLLNSLFQPQDIVSSIQQIIKTRGQVKIEALANQYFISQRQFERRFKEYAGLSPKLFARIVRFHASCMHFGDDNKSLTDIAYDCGYYDQSHFIHDFKQFSGHHPKRYFSGKAEGTEWMS